MERLPFRKPTFKLMGWKLTDKEIQHHDNKEETGTRKAEQKQESQQIETATETRGRVTPSELTKTRSQDPKGDHRRKREARKTKKKHAS